MSDYTELVKALLSASTVSTVWEKLMLDAAAAIEALEAEVEKYKRLNNALENLLSEDKEPKRGEWELIDGVEPMRWGCSRCKYMSWETSSYCPRCGAKMEVQTK